MNENIPCPEQVKTYVERLFDAFGNATSIFFVAFPSFLLWFACKKLTSYYKDNGSRHKEIMDFIDQESHKPFKKAAIPFIKSVDESLTEQVLSAINDEPIDNIYAFMQDFQAKKYNLLKTWDITLLEETFDFQDSLQKIVRLRKDQGTLEGYIRRSRTALFFVAVSSLVSTILGILFIYFTKVNLIEKISFLFFVTCIIFISISAISFLTHIYYDSKIDSLKTKK